MEPRLTQRLTWDEMMRVPVAELDARSRVPIRIFDRPDEMFEFLARFTADLIKADNGAGRMTRVVWPCGPKKHYPMLAEITNRERISWKNTFNFQMDEWLTWDGRLLDPDHPFNLQSYLRRELFNRIDGGLRPDEDHCFFHDPLDLGKVDRAIDAAGGVDVVFGGFGFTGHFALNEPITSRWTEVTPQEFCSARTRVVMCTDETIVMHSHRSVGGDFRLVPPMGITLGLKDLLAAGRIRLVSDGGSWKQAIFRIICMHEPTVKYPATFVQGHPDVELMVDSKTAAPPPRLFTG